MWVLLCTARKDTGSACWRVRNRDYVLHPSTLLPKQYWNLLARKYSTVLHNNFHYSKSHGECKQKKKVFWQQWKKNPQSMLSAVSGRDFFFSPYIENTTSTWCPRRLVHVLSSSVTCTHREKAHSICGDSTGLEPLLCPDWITWYCWAWLVPGISLLRAPSPSFCSSANRTLQCTTAEAQTSIAHISQVCRGHWYSPLSKNHDRGAEMWEPHRDFLPNALIKETNIQNRGEKNLIYCEVHLVQH